MIILLQIQKQFAMLSVLIGAVLVMAVTAQRPVMNTLLVTNGARDGEIFRDEFCPTGTYAAGFQILVNSR